MTVNIQEKIKEAAHQHHLDAAELANVYAGQYQRFTEKVGSILGEGVPTDPFDRQIYALDRAVKLLVDDQIRKFSAHYAEFFFTGDTAGTEEWRQKIVSLPISIQDAIRDNMTGALGHNSWGRGSADLYELPKLALQVRDDFTLFHPILNTPQEADLYFNLYKKRSEQHGSFDSELEKNVKIMNLSKEEQDYHTFVTRPQLRVAALKNPWIVQNKAYNFSSITDPAERGDYDRKRNAASPALPPSPPEFDGPS